METRDDGEKEEGEKQEEDEAKIGGRKGRRWRRRLRRKLSQSPQTLRGTECSSGAEEGSVTPPACSLCLTFLITTPH